MFTGSVSVNVVARFIEPNKLGNYNLILQYIGSKYNFRFSKEFIPIIPGWGKEVADG